MSGRSAGASFIMAFFLAAISRPLAAASGEGSAGADFLQLIPGARSAALAGCDAVLGADAEVQFFNPAGILELTFPQAGFGHVSWWEGVHVDSAWFVQPLATQNSFGLQVSLATVPFFDSTEDQMDAPAAGWSGSVSGAYAVRLNREVSAGVQAKGIASSWGRAREWGLAADVGVQSCLANRQWVLSGALRNAGVLIAQENQTALPLALSLGSGYMFFPDAPSRFSTGVECTIPAKGRIRWGMGMEGWWMNRVALRIGLQNDDDSGDWLQTGLGLRWQAVHFDYAVSWFGVLGTAHRLSVGYDWGDQKDLPRPRASLQVLSRTKADENGLARREIVFLPSLASPAGIHSWELVILSRNGKTVKKISGERQAPVQIVWDGTDAAENPVNHEEFFRFHFQLTDPRQYLAEASGEILPESFTQLPPLKVLPRGLENGTLHFSPTQAGQTAPIKAWSVQIVNPEGQVIKRFAGVGSFPKDLHWEGQNTAARLGGVANGWRFVVRLQENGGKESESEFPIVAVAAAVKAHSQTASFLPDPVVFAFADQENSEVRNWALDILEAQGQHILRSYSGRGRLPEKIVWDSRDTQGALVPSDHRYRYVLRLQDSHGNLWEQLSPVHAAEVKILEQNSTRLKIKIESILFDVNQAEIKPEMMDKLKKTADLIRGYAVDTGSIRIDGHTDEVGTEEYNLDLSVRRAKMVMRYLVEEEKLPSGIMEIYGFGKRVPVAAGKNEQAQSANRRVEITLVFIPKK